MHQKSLKSLKFFFGFTAAGDELGVFFLSFFSRKKGEGSCTAGHVRSKKPGKQLVVLFLRLVSFPKHTVRIVTKLCQVMAQYHRTKEVLKFKFKLFPSSHKQTTFQRGRHVASDHILHKYKTRQLLFVFCFFFFSKFSRHRCHRSLSCCQFSLRFFFFHSLNKNYLKSEKTIIL
jgi:hypothetical protein